MKTIIVFKRLRLLYVQFVMVQIMLFNAHFCITEWIYVVWSSPFGGRWGTAPFHQGFVADARVGLCAVALVWGPVCAANVASLAG